MKEGYLDTAFGNLIFSYAYVCDGLTDEEIEKALRYHAKKLGGGISCRYSILHEKEEGNIWHHRICQVGLEQSGCQMYKGFPN